VSSRTIAPLAATNMMRTESKIKMAGAGDYAQTTFDLVVLKRRNDQHFKIG
jgi:hypothetical protein